MALITSTEAGATGRYIDLGSPSGMDDIGAQTIIVYCKPASIPPSVFGYIYAKGNSSGYGPRFGINTSGQLAFGVASNSGGSLNPSKFASSTLTASTWQHLQVTWDGGLLASGVNLYVDAGSALANTPADGISSITSDASHKVFLMNRTGLGREFVGDIAYIAVWSGVLNSTQRQNARDNGPLSEPTGLKLLWANDQDYSTNAYTASARSTRVTGSTPSNTALGGDTTISATVGDAVAAGITASVSSAVTIATTVGNAVADGITATISTSGTTTITATVGNAVADGVTANIANMAFDASYERSSFNPTGSSIVGAGDSAIISIVPKVQESETAAWGTVWMEPSVDISGVNGYRPTFRFLNYKSAADGLHAGTGAWFSTRRPMYSTDSGLTWTYFDTAVTRDTGNEWIEFRNSTAFSADTVRISRSRQITVHQIGDWVAAYAAAHSFFTPTASAVAFTPTGSVSGFSAQTFIADEFSTQTDSLGATIPVTPLYAGEINDTSLMPADGSSKRTAFVSGGMHAGEDYAHWSFKGFMDYLAGSSSEAQALRRRYRILVYPMINAPGRAGGGWRGSWTQGTGGADDTSRHFDDAKTLDIIIKAKAAITTDLGSGPKDWAIDFHGTYNNTWEIICPYTSAINNRLHSLQQTNSGETVVKTISYQAGYLVTWLQDTMGVTYGTVFEHGDPAPVTDGDLDSYGAALVPSLATMSAEGAFAIIAEPGNAVAAGITATITTTGTTTVSATPGNAVADGVTAGVTQSIASTVGDASAAGITAAVIRAISGIPGDAVANGTTATITGTTVISATPGDAVAAGVDAQITSVSSNDGDGGMSRKRYYLRRKGKILLFDTVAQADDYLEAEEEAQKAIAAAKSRGAKKRIAAKILKAVEPVESVEIAPLQELVKAYSVPVNLPQLLSQQDYSQVMDVRAMIQRIQDDEDDELLLLLA